MGRTFRRLTVKEVLNAKPAPDRRVLMLCDGDGLYLQVSRDPNDDTNIRRSWVFRYEYRGQRHDIGLGPLRHLDLAQARQRVREKRQQILAGVDPYTAKQQLKRDHLAQLATKQGATTFRACAEACIASHESAWGSAKHRAQWQATVETYAYPVLGDLAVDDIDTPHIVKVLEPIWKEKPETASRVRGRIEKILGWATVRGFRTGDNPARWRGHLAELFPAKGKARAVEHYAALPYSDVPALMAELRAEFEHPSARALELLILTATRTAEARDVMWDEIDLAAKTWTIPAKRMKGGKAHKIPLSDRAVEILKAAPGREGRVFPIGISALLDRLKRMRPGMTTHGFRSAFTDWAHERTNYPNAAIDMALAHAIPSAVEAAYRRGDLFEKRRQLMDDWAAWCSRPVPTGATVTAIGVRNVAG